jgi:hypothetical protein
MNQTHLYPLRFEPIYQYRLWGGRYPVRALSAKPVMRERLFLCKHFRLWRHQGSSPFLVGAAGSPRVLVCIAGNGSLDHKGGEYLFGKGDVRLLAAMVGECLCRSGDPVTLLEISLPKGTTP